nr:G protein-coupled receptor [Proales similis]
MIVNDEADCTEHLINTNQLGFKGYGCNGTFDGFVCWPAIEANSTITIPCPEFKGFFDTKKLLSKFCTADALWEGYNETNRYAGKTNFTSCFNALAIKESKSLERSGLVYDINKYIELSGLLLSLICVITSLFIFLYHKTLICKRTRIHLNLFISILLLIIIRCLLFMDRPLFKLFNQSDSLQYESFFMLLHKSVCPMISTVFEYCVLCNFMWMLNEGIYINIQLTYSVFNANMSCFITAFYFVGWGLPALITFVWAFTLYQLVGIDDVCWYGFFRWKSYWIIQTPILVALVVNFVCLANVIRILATKLKESQSSELEQIKKSLKAAILLLPLLGITHVLEIYHEEPANFILNLVVSVINSVLVFYQGVFLSILYCFMNNEVKEVIKRHWLSRFHMNSSPKHNSRQTTEIVQAKELVPLKQNKSQDETDQAALV